MAWAVVVFFGVPFVLFLTTFLVGLVRRDFEYASLGFIGAFFSGFGVVVSVASVMGTP